MSIRKHTAMARFSLLLLASLAAAVRVSVASASAGRLVSVADLHGDFERAVTILAHAGLIDKARSQNSTGSVLFFEGASCSVLEGSHRVGLNVRSFSGSTTCINMCKTLRGFFGR